MGVFMPEVVSMKPFWVAVSFPGGPVNFENWLYQTTRSCWVLVMGWFWMSMPTPLGGPVTVRCAWANKSSPFMILRPVPPWLPIQTLALMREL